MPADSPRGRTFGNYILAQRLPIGWLLVAITVFMSYWAVHVPIATKFEDLFPLNHPNTALYRKYRIQYGGALTLAILLRVDRGDIFNFKTLQAIQDVNHEVDILPGVNHNEVMSLASYRVIYARASPGLLSSTPYMYPKIPANQAQVDALKDNVRAHQDQLAGLVTRDLKGTLIIASFNDRGIDYRTLFDDVRTIIYKHQDANTHFYVSGAVMFAAWGYHYLPLLTKIFAASFGLMVLIAFFTLGGRVGWWAPIVTGVVSAFWGVGFMSLMGYNFDPVMLVVPLILTARDLAHGIQWQGRYYAEVDKLDDHILACVATTDAMFKPGLLAVLANIAGIVFVAFSDFPVLKQIGLGGAVWLGASLVLVFIGQPILMSFLRRPRPRLVRAERATIGDWLAGVALNSAFARTLLIAGGLAAIAIGFFSYQHIPIGYQIAGTPLYRPEANVNRDTAEMSRFLPTNIAWVVLDSPEFPSPESAFGTKSLRMADDMAAFLLQRGDVAAVIGFGGLAEKPMNQLLHNSSPKFFSLPDSEALSASLWGFFFSASAPDEPTAYFANAQSARNTCIRLLLPDHTSARLTRIRNDLATFVRERVAADPRLKDVRVLYLGGEAGLYQATDDVIVQVNRHNLILVLGAIFILAAIGFRSMLAGGWLVIVALMANLVAYTYMTREVVGLTVDTISVISLGLGVGISYAIYALAAIREEIASGVTLNQAIRAGLSGGGTTIVGTYLLMVAGLVPWVISPVLFQNEMSALLILLMTTNLIAGLLILPALLVLQRPHFLIRHERRPPEAGERMAARSAS